MSETKKPAEATPRDFRRTDPAVAKASEFPVPVAGEFRVHITREAYQKMKQHAGTTSEVELCGVLVGQVGRDSAGYFLAIRGAIEAEGARNHGAQVTFTHEAWTHIHAVKDRDFPDQRIVGWYHTHPGFGVCLSSMDMLIQENFFSEPYQVAVVLETVHRAEGCFAWVDGRCAPLRRYWVGDDEVSLTAGQVEPPEAKPSEAKKTAATEAEEKAPAPLALGSWTAIIMMVLFFAAGVLVGQMFLASKMQEAIQQNLEGELYGILEHASLGALASQDLKAVHAKVQAVRESLDKEKAAETVAQLQAVENLLANLETEYDKRPALFRKELQDLLTYRQQLGERLSTTQRHQQELAVLTAELYLIRMKDLVGDPGQVDPAQWPEDKRAAVQYCLDRMIRLYPDTKGVLQKMYPGLVEYYYPEGAPAADSEGAKDAAAKSG
jgi:proteasome lid subunit RPN8/RPN11